MKGGVVATFYSYKGGVGRTQALANVGALLARWGYKVLCVDWDLEAPGLHLYFERWIKELNSPGLVELIERFSSGFPVSWQDFVTSVKIPDSRAVLSFIKAGRQDVTYVQRMQALDWDFLYEEQNLGAWLEQVRAEWCQQFDFVLIDSRTGISDLGGICTIQMPDVLVLLFTANQQSLSGAIDVAQRAQAQRQHLPADRGRLICLPIPTRFEGRVEYALAQEWLGTFARTLPPLYSDWLHQEITPLEMLNLTKLPYVPYWSFGEKLPVVDEGTRDPEGLGYALETVTALLASRLESSELLVRDRDAFVSSVSQKPVLAAESRAPKSDGLVKPVRPVRLFIRYAHADRKWLSSLEVHLAPLMGQGVIAVWTERILVPSDGWTGQISTALAQADIVLVLLSADFLASGYTNSAEFTQILQWVHEGKMRLIPILLRPVELIDTGLERLQMLPGTGLPVTRWENTDAAWVDVVQGIRAAVVETRYRVHPPVGRSIDRDELLERVRELGPPSLDHLDVFERNEDEAHASGGHPAHRKSAG